MHDRVALITGAAGGVGSTIARLLAHTHVLVLTDTDQIGLDQFTHELNQDGYQAVAVPGDLCNPDVHSKLRQHCDQRGRLKSIVNSAGLSPAHADWRAIIKVNAVAASMLANVIEPLLEPGSACVMIASVAGHLGPTNAEIEALLDDPSSGNLLNALEPALTEMVVLHGGTIQGHAYSLSKQAVIRMCERRSLPWGQKGARIVSISPGPLATAMGRLEARQGNRAQALVDATPAGRWGTAMDVARTAEFLLSDAASYITGCDVRVDGGAVAAWRGRAF
jgi:NAD(P)-dependent dehydrogenase (short-subunit alcohol dehydrogenase family)